MSTQAVAPLLERLETAISTKLAEHSDRLLAVEQKLTRPQGGTGNEPVTPLEARGPYLAKNQKFVDLVRDDRYHPGQLSLAKMVKGMATGHWDGAEEEKAALATTPASAGGTLIPTVVSNEIIDFARAASVCVRAGARSVPLTDGNLRWPVVTNDPQGEWKAENVALSDESSLTFDSVSVLPKTLMTIIRGSVEAFEDAPMLQGVVESALTGSLGLQLDAAGLYGTGQNNDPVGLKSNQNVNVVAAGAPVSYSLISESVERVANENGTPNAIIMAPRSFYQLDRKLSAVDGQPLRAFPSYDALQKFVTNTIPTNLSTGSPATAVGSDLFVGDFTQLVFGIRTGFVIEATRLESDAFKKLQIAIRIYGRFDIAVLRPAWFDVTTVTAS